MASFQTAVALVFVVFGVVSSCPEGYHRLGSKCYAVLREEFSWPEAQTACRTFGGFLAEIRSSEEYHLISGWLSQIKATIPSVSVWSSGSDMLIEGQWMHPGSTRLTYAHWAHGQPNNHNHKEHCLSLWGNGHYQYNDLACSIELNPLCQSRSG
ncbi:hypothetical protein ScPMuIL_013093 [Solemya velum]